MCSTVSSEYPPLPSRTCRGRRSQGVLGGGAHAQSASAASVFPGDGACFPQEGAGGAMEAPGQRCLRVRGRRTLPARCLKLRRFPTACARFLPGCVWT